MEKKLTFDEYKAISKEIKKLCDNNQYEEALALCTDENCKFYKAI